jgi:hypothetical protein
VVEILGGHEPEPTGPGGQQPGHRGRRTAAVAVGALTVGVLIGAMLTGGDNPAPPDEAVPAADVAAPPPARDRPVPAPGDPAGGGARSGGEPGPGDDTEPSDPGPSTSEDLAEEAKPSIRPGSHDRLAGPVAIYIRPRSPRAEPVWILDGQSRRSRTDLVLTPPGHLVWWGGRLLFVHEHRLMAIDPQLVGPPNDLGPGEWLVPGPDPGVAWPVVRSVRPGGTTVARLDAATGERDEMLVDGERTPVLGVADGVLAEGDGWWFQRPGHPARRVPVDGAAALHTTVGPLAFFVHDLRLVVLDVPADHVVADLDLTAGIGPRGFIRSACPSPDGSLVAIVDHLGAGEVLDTTTGEVRARFSAPGIDAVLAWTGPTQLLNGGFQATPVGEPIRAVVRVLDLPAATNHPVAVLYGLGAWSATSPSGPC